MRWQDERNITIQADKRAFYLQLEMGLSEAYTEEVMVENMALCDIEEGIAAFFEKRAPSWQG